MKASRSFFRSSGGRSLGRPFFSVILSRGSPELRTVSCGADRTEASSASRSRAAPHIPPRRRAPDAATAPNGRAPTPKALPWGRESRPLGLPAPRSTTQACSVRFIRFVSLRHLRRSGPSSTGVFRSEATSRAPTSSITARSSISMFSRYCTAASRPPDMNA